MVKKIKICACHVKISASWIKVFIFHVSCNFSKEKEFAALPQTLDCFFILTSIMASLGNLENFAIFKQNANFNFVKAVGKNFGIFVIDLCRFFVFDK